MKPTKEYMEMEYTKVLVRDGNGQPALWLDINKVEVIDDRGNRTADYTGTTLNDANSSIPFDPSVEDADLAVEQWKMSFSAR